MMARNTLTSTFLPALMAAALMLSGCGVSGGDGAGDTVPSRTDNEFNAFTEPLFLRPSPRSCQLNDINTWAYQSMLDYYLFYEQVQQNVDTATYESPEELIRDLRVAPNDTFSYVTDETTYSAFFNEGETFGYGWNFARAADNALLFSLIEPNSPLDAAGVQRGEQLLAINGIQMPDFDQLTRAERQNILGAADEVKTLELTILARDGTTRRQVSVTTATYALQTVLETEIIEQNGVSVGYLHFYQFVNTSSQELQQAFSQFKAAGVSELVIDLRFNGGGRIAIANELASYVLGNSPQDRVFTTFAFNNKYRFQNQSLYFENFQDSLALNRVFVLQSGNTCSASELVVNSLRPFVEVITVGSTSCGKPYATTPNTACGKVVNALEIELLNASGEGDYFNGIAADCAATENVRRPLGDPSEPLLAKALDYIGTGSCSIMASRFRTRHHELTVEFKPPWHSSGTL